jgi:hypothetical protein
MRRSEGECPSSLKLKQNHIKKTHSYGLVWEQIMGILIKLAKNTCLGKNPCYSDTAFIYTENLYFLFYWVFPFICALGRKEITFFYLVLRFEYCVNNDQEANKRPTNFNALKKKKLDNVSDENV